MRLAALPIDPGTPVQELRDMVVADGALDRLNLNLWFVNFRLSAYYNILKALGTGGYRDEDLGHFSDVQYGDEHFTCFQFDYDWRLDLASNARRLEEFIAEKHAYVTTEVERRFDRQEVNIKFDIVAHSMGGLLSRYFLRYGAADLPENGDMPEVTWAGTKHVRRLIMVGTPNAGSLGALDQLVHGFGGLPFVPRYEPAVLGTFPALYQILPRTRHGALVSSDDPRGEPLDIYDPELWVKMGWGLASPEQEDVLEALLPDVDSAAERRRMALVQQKKLLLRARRFDQALGTPARPPQDVSLVLFAGDAVKTDAVMAVDEESGNLWVSSTAPGDGSVLRSSALLDERVGGEWSPRLVSPIAWRQVVFFFNDHLGITKDPVFTDNLLYLILESPD